VELGKGLCGKGQQWFQIVGNASAGCHRFIKGHPLELEKMVSTLTLIFAIRWIIHSLFQHEVWNLSPNTDEGALQKHTL
jgi:hypothetical protein